MNALTKGVAATVLAGTAVTIGASMAEAAPAKKAPKNPDAISAGIAPGVTYTGNAKAGAAEIKTPWGTFSTSPGQVAVKDANGRAVFGNPSKVASPNAPVIPKASVSSAKTPSAAWTPPTPVADMVPPNVRSMIPREFANMVPGDVAGMLPRDAGKMIPREVASAITPMLMAASQQPAFRVPAAAEGPKKPLTAEEKEEAIYGAIGNVATHFGFAYGVGAMVGGVAGAVVGCPVGAVMGMGAAFPIAPLAAPVGCFIGIGTLGTSGAIIGGAVAATPVGIASASYEISKLQKAGAL
ncbi:hypothetical protein GOARA_067_00530 [Gordonia araii NBRC 100433]|uniref:Uncharacterized protein n=1 Tax=Gordonia araii NBRC 100433 TaxID=1073574 RepID=G7H5Y9_9ACTN|nr:hypothetical protein [Gordonia araii]NNG99262.1 hypothetical protein [Gordonia araii NBRC 100433]GAB11311.1 hypothetical protein GOARA_067_00530 [Gordonia araii NBRC 100433]